MSKKEEEVYSTWKQLDAAFKSMPLYDLTAAKLASLPFGSRAILFNKESKFNTPFNVYVIRYDKGDKVLHFSRVNPFEM